jgi:hypothetical protein
VLLTYGDIAFHAPSFGRYFTEFRELGFCYPINLRDDFRSQESYRYANAFINWNDLGI